MRNGEKIHVSEAITSVDHWRKSSRCETNTCLEIGVAEGVLLIRNSADPNTAVSFTASEWNAFVAGLDAGDFDDLISGSGAAA